MLNRGWLEMDMLISRSDRKSKGAAQNDKMMNRECCTSRYGEKTKSLISTRAWKRYFKCFSSDKSKCPTGHPPLQLVTLHCFKIRRQTGHLARRKGLAVQVNDDIGSSVLANGVLGVVFGVVTSLVVDMAFIVQGMSSDELPIDYMEQYEFLSLNLHPRSRLWSLDS